MKTVGRMMKKNDLNSEFWQAVRGICILAVIMIHCPSGIGYSDIEQECWLILRQFINFPVAIFVFMAGYFVNTRKVQTNKLAYYVNRGGAAANSLFYLEFGIRC